MVKNDTLSLENLKIYFKDVRKNRIYLEDYIATIKKYTEKYFYNNSLKTDDGLLREIAHTIYFDIRSHAGSMYNRGELHAAMKFMQKLDLDIRLFVSKNAIKKLEELEYNLMFAYLLYVNNVDYEAYLRCSFATSEYYTSKKEILIRIGNEEHKVKKSHTDIAMYYSNLICFSKFAQIICSKTGIKNEIGHHYWTEKYFEEKLCYLSEEITSVYQMITAKNWVWESDVLQSVIIDDIQNPTAFLRIRKKIRIFFKGLKLSFFRIISGYGEKPIRMLICSGVIIIIFGLLYSIRQNELSNSLDYIYRSLLIFFSFGFIDNSIKQDSINKILFSTEIFLGIIFINGYIVILARKLFR